MIPLGLLACGPGDEAPGDAPIPEPTEPTGPCEPVAEIPGNGIDEACNGWDDEVGVGVTIRSAAAVTWIGGKDDALGWDLDGGVDGEGQTWLLAAAPTAAMWYGRGQLLGDRAPTDGIWDASVVQEISESRPFEAVGVAAWVTPFVLHMPSFIGVYPVATGIDYVDDAWLYQNSGSSDIEIAPDLTGDGVEDLLDGWEGLRVYAGPPPAGEWGDPWLHVTATPESQNFAHQVGEVGDLTGDGLPELTAYGEEDDIGGLAWVIPGDLAGVVAIEDVGIRVEGEHPEGQAGFTIVVGDATGDGTLDLLTGAFLALNRTGVSYLFPGPILDDGKLADGVAHITALYEYEWCGYEVELVPDQDGDLRDEVAIGCPGDTFFGEPIPGRVEIYPGGDAVGVLDAHDAAAVYHGSLPYDRLGWVMTADADLTGDGLADLAVGAPYADPGGYASGAIYLLTAPLW